MEKVDRHKAAEAETSASHTADIVNQQRRSTEQG